MSGLPIKLIIGLGNPGDEYARTRHNAGFWFADELARRHGGTLRLEARYQSEVARLRIAGSEVWLVKPMSFMNRSGGPAGQFANFYKIAAEEILVGYDEMDFQPGDVRLRQGGSAGGHNGMKDLLAHLGDSFWRLRIGVGHPGSKEQVINHVLSRASAAEDALIREGVSAAVDIVPFILEHGAQKAMHKLHSRKAGPGVGA